MQWGVHEDVYCAVRMFKVLQCHSGACTWTQVQSNIVRCPHVLVTRQILKCDRVVLRAGAHKPMQHAQVWHAFCGMQGKEETFEFLESVLHEVLELFPSPYIHIGGDEVRQAISVSQVGNYHCC